MSVPPIEPPGAMPEADTRCYRHPDRRAGVGCQRCGRPICPSCMITAPVGFQCPECAQTGARQQRLVDVHRARTRPVVTVALIVVNVAVYLAGSIASARFQATGVGGDFNVDFGLFSACVDEEWWRLVTSGFLHAGIFHLGLNMWALYVLGSVLEPALGRLRFVLVYAVSLLGGALGVVVVDSMGTPGLTVGASGAIFGLLGALVVLQLSRGLSPMASGLIGLIGINLVLTFAVPGISIGGHLGGLVVGAIAGGILLWGTAEARQSDAERAVRMAMVVGLGIACVVGAIGIAGSLVAPQSIFVCPA